VTERNLAVFSAPAANGKKLGMERRLELIHREFPATVSLDWKRAFDNDVDLFGRIVRDILKLDQVVPGRPGPRPDPEPDRAMGLLRQLMAEDYISLPFDEAFTILADQRSLTQLERKVGLPRTIVRRLMRGIRSPTMVEMASVAEAYGKHPSYFVEFRAAVIAGAIVLRLEGAPETSIGLYRRIVGVGQ